MDAQRVEAAFTTKLSQFGDSPTEDKRGRSELGRTGDRVFGISKPVRERDRNHLRFVASQPCLICGRGPSDAHHIEFAEQRAMGRKVSDKFTVPVCRMHHRELHRRGNERAWWETQGFDPLPIAATLWETTQAVDPVPAELADILDGTGEHAANGVDATVRHQNNETKPILRPEAQ